MEIRRDGGTSPPSHQDNYVTNIPLAAILSAAGRPQELGGPRGASVGPSLEPHLFRRALQGARLELLHGAVTRNPRTLYGRSIRHREPIVCEIAALAMYLWYQLEDPE